MAASIDSRSQNLATIKKCYSLKLVRGKTYTRLLRAEIIYFAKALDECTSLDELLSHC